MKTAALGRAGIPVLAVAAVLVGLQAPAEAAPGSGAVQVTGSLERLHLDRFDESAPGVADEVAVVRAGASAVRVPASSVSAIAEGATVRVGVAASATTSLRSAAQSAPVAADAAANPEAGVSVTGVQVLADAPAPADAPAAHDVTVVLATWPGQPVDSTSADQVAATVNGPVNSYWRTVTGGALGFRVAAARDWVTVPTAACVAGDSTTNAFAFWSAVKSAVGFVEGPGRHLVVHIPAGAPCGGTSGLGTVGAGLDSGGLLWVAGSTQADVIGHELGHNVGLGHSSSLSCSVDGARVSDASPAQCVKRGYWDVSDIMGFSWGHTGYLNAAHLARLGVTGAFADVATTTTLDLGDRAGSGATRAVRVRVGGDTYYVEYRAASGLDSWLGTTPGWAEPGVAVYRDFDRSSLSAADLGRLPSRESYLLDADPTTTDANLGDVHATVPAGRWAVVAGGQLAVRVLATGADSAQVEVRVGADDVATISSGTPSTPAVPVTGTPPTTQQVTRPAVRLTVGRLMWDGSHYDVPGSATWKVAAPAAATRVRTSTITALASSAQSSSLRISAFGTWTANPVTVSVTDGSGATTSASATVYSRLVPESLLRHSSTWRSSASRFAAGRREYVARTSHAWASARVNASGIGLVAVKAPGRGRVSVYVDGRYAGTVNLSAPRTTGTSVVWASPVLRSGTHTVTLRTRSGAPTGIDGFVLLR